MLPSRGYRHTQVGDQPENIGVLVPKEVLKTVAGKLRSGKRQIARTPPYRDAAEFFKCAVEWKPLGRESGAVGKNRKKA